MKEDLEWVKKVIASCLNEDHTHYIPGIIELFKKKWNWVAAWQELTEIYYEKLRELDVISDPR